MSGSFAPKDGWNGADIVPKEGANGGGSNVVPRVEAGIATGSFAPKDGANGDARHPTKARTS